jgi:hypothetical protein
MTARIIIMPGYAAVNGDAIEASVFSNAIHRPIKPSTLKRDPKIAYLYLLKFFRNLNMCKGVSSQP